MAESLCPNCGATVSVPVAPTVGTQVRCSECDWMLEVISADPFEVDFPLTYWEDEDGGVDDGDADLWKGE